MKRSKSESDMKFRAFTFLATATLLLASCSDDDVKPNPIESQSKEDIVYVAGVEKVGDALQPYVAKYWRNGVAHKLTDGTKDALANTVYIDGDDVYVGGAEENNARLTYAIIWKNGKRIHLTDSASTTTNSQVNDIIVANNDVYAAGSHTADGFIYAVYWKNEEMVILGKSKKYITTTALAIDGENVHVVGIETTEDKKNIARYWINGVVSALPGGEVASDIDVDNGDVYISGYNSKGGNYWKNGQSISLQDSYHTSGIQVVEGNVFVAGPGWYWSNGVGTPLADSKNREANVSSIFVSGSDVYTSGFTNNGSNYVAQFWKNGKPTDLTNGSRHALANDIFITREK
jgi:hypothetical protein